MLRQNKIFLPSSPPPRLGGQNHTSIRPQRDCASRPLALIAQDCVPRKRRHIAGDTARRGVCRGSRSLGSCVVEALVPLACPFQRLAPRDLAVGGGEGGPVGGEGEGGPVGGEGEGGRLGLFSSPLPGLFSSPLPGLFSPPAWYSRPDYRSVCWRADAGGTLARPKAVRTTRRRGDGGAPRRRRRAAFSRFGSPSAGFSSTQPVSLRGRRGWECKPPNLLVS